MAFPVSGCSGFRSYLVTCLVSVAQLVVITWLCWDEGITSIGFKKQTFERHETLTFRGLETLKHVKVPNLMIGPRALDLVRQGALFAPCVREDYRMNAQYILTMDQGLNSGNKTVLGCCQLSRFNVAGTTSKIECERLTEGWGEWIPFKYSERPIGQNMVHHVLRPCCHVPNGQCSLTSPEHCEFIGGIFHTHGEHCAQINCLDGICTLNRKDEHPGLRPRRFSQHWRLGTSIFLHHGILDCGLYVTIQLWIGRWVESSLGWFRMALVYFIAGAGGHIVGSIFSPYYALHVGGGPAVSGVLAVALMELLQLWNTIREPGKRLVKLCTSLLVLFIVATLRQVSIFSNLAGFIFGLGLAAFFLLHAKQSRCNTLLKLLYFIIFSLLLLTTLVVFYEVQSVGSCSFCSLIDCISYRPDIC